MFLLSLSLSLVFLRHSPITTSRRLRKGPAFQCPPFQCRPPCPPLPAAAAQPPPVASANCVSPAAAAKRGSFTTTTRRAAVNFPCWPMRWATLVALDNTVVPLLSLCPKFSSSEPWLFFLLFLGAPIMQETLYVFAGYHGQQRARHGFRLARGRARQPEGQSTNHLPGIT